MWLLRIGVRGRWSHDRSADNPEDVEAAAKDLKLNPRHQGLSVYRPGEEGAEQVALHFALTCRDAPPDHVDYVVFPGELAERLGLTVVPTKIEGLEPFLNE